MKRLISSILALAMSCPLAGCLKVGLSQPDFPLEEGVIVAALEKTGLPGEISQDETKSYAKGHIAYTLREQAGSKGMTSAISSAITRGKRFLQIIYTPPTIQEEPAFAWENCKQQFMFASLLYGGFADEDELYRAFADMDIAGAEVEVKGETRPGDKGYEWEAQLPGAYCVVRYRLSAADRTSYSLGSRIELWRSNLYITLYENKALYEKMQQDGRKAYQKEQKRIAEIKDARSKAAK